MLISETRCRRFFLSSSLFLLYPLFTIKPRSLNLSASRYGREQRGIHRGSNTRWALLFLPPPLLTFPQCRYLASLRIQLFYEYALLPPFFPGGESLGYIITAPFPPPLLWIKSLGPGDFSLLVRSNRLNRRLSHCLMRGKSCGSFYSIPS